jgi:hypothetical protein
MNSELRRSHFFYAYIFIYTHIYIYAYLYTYINISLLMCSVDLYIPVLFIPQRIPLEGRGDLEQPCSCISRLPSPTVSETDWFTHQFSGGHRQEHTVKLQVHYQGHYGSFSVIWYGYNSQRLLFRSPLPNHSIQTQVLLEYCSLETLQIQPCQLPLCPHSTCVYIHRPLVARFRLLMGLASIGARLVAVAKQFAINIL